VNGAIYSAAGPEFVQATKSRGETLSPGAVLPVELPPFSPLRTQEGVSHVIHVLGPNMNPLRPNCLNGDYVTGERLLRNAYRALFEAFSALAGGRDSETSRENRTVSPAEGLREGLGTGEVSGGDLVRTSERREGDLEGQTHRRDEMSEKAQDKEKAAPKNAFELMMQSAKRRTPGGPSKGSDEGMRSSKEAGPVPGVPSPGRKDEGAQRQGGGGGWSGKGGWSEALRDVALRPERHRDEVLDEEGGAVIIKDLYHKVSVSRVKFWNSSQQRQSVITRRCMFRWNSLDPGAYPSTSRRDGFEAF
jgi:aprataxin